MFTSVSTINASVLASFFLHLILELEGCRSLAGEVEVDSMEEEVECSKWEQLELRLEET